jgi:hypothetical protein
MAHALQKSPPDGYEFSIRTAGLPDRWRKYDAELTFAFDELTNLVVSSMPQDARPASPLGSGLSLSLSDS